MRRTGAPSDASNGACDACPSMPSTAGRTSRCRPASTDSGFPGRASTSVPDGRTAANAGLPGSIATRPEQDLGAERRERRLDVVARADRDAAARDDEVVAGGLGEDALRAGEVVGHATADDGLAPEPAERQADERRVRVVDLTPAQGRAGRNQLVPGREHEGARAPHARRRAVAERGHGRRPVRRAPRLRRSPRRRRRCRRPPDARRHRRPAGRAPRPGRRAPSPARRRRRRRRPRARGRRSRSRRRCPARAPAVVAGGDLERDGQAAGRLRRAARSRRAPSWPTSGGRGTAAPSRARGLRAPPAARPRRRAASPPSAAPPALRRGRACPVWRRRPRAARGPWYKRRGRCRALTAMGEDAPGRGFRVLRPLPPVRGSAARPGRRDRDRRRGRGHAARAER